MIKESCTLCKYFLRIPEDEVDEGVQRVVGHCRRSPPMYDPSLGEDAQPLTTDNSWCGEFKYDTPRFTCDD